jgi:hypothetical protein
MQRSRCSSRAFFGSLANRGSDSDEDAVASNSRSGGPSADEDEEDEDEADDEDEAQESGDEYQDSYVNQVFRKEYQEAREDGTWGLLYGTTRATPDSEIGVRSSGRSRRTVNYKERQVKDIPFRPVWQTPKVRYSVVLSH